ncbi:MAG: hypothetical protein RIE58_01310 [Vicingaceae bacterium]
MKTMKMCFAFVLALQFLACAGPAEKTEESDATENEMIEEEMAEPTEEMDNMESAEMDEEAYQEVDLSTLDTSMIIRPEGSEKAASTFYRAKCRTQGPISSWHYNRGNAAIAKKHHERKWSTGGVTDPNHRVTIESMNN